MTLESDREIVVATNMSEPGSQNGGDDLPPESPRARWLWRVLQIVVPAAVAIAMVAVLTGERARVDCDLQLQAPAEATPGSTLPVRGLFYTGLQTIEGPRLTAGKGSVELLDGAQRVIARHALALGLQDTLEATIPIAVHWRGPFRVRMSVRDRESTVSVEQSLIVREDAQPLAASPRPLRPLQQLSAGPLRREAAALAPSSLELQVAGGACAPEAPCELLIHVGEPAAVLGVEGYGALELQRPAPTEPSADIVALRVVTHGPEAELRLHATVDQQLAARRTFRLPIAQAMVPIDTESVINLPSSSLRFTRSFGDAPCIVDLFHAERWVRTWSVPHCDQVTWDRPLSAGLWRVQTRDDAFGGDAAATRLIYVRGVHESDASMLARLAHEVKAARPDDLMAHRLAERAPLFAERDGKGYARWLLASLDDRLIALPATVSSYPLALNALEAKRARLRIYCVIALLLSALAAVLMIGRRGLLASSRARDIMQAAGDADAHSGARRLRMTLTVIASAASIAIAFIAIAAYVIARG